MRMKDLTEELYKTGDSFWKGIKDRTNTPEGSFQLGSYIGIPTGLAMGGASYAATIPYITNAATALGLLGTMGMGALLAGGFFGLFGLGIYGVKRWVERYGNRQRRE